MRRRRPNPNPSIQRISDEEIGGAGSVLDLECVGRVRRGTEHRRVGDDAAQLDTADLIRGDEGSCLELDGVDIERAGRGVRLLDEDIWGARDCACSECTRISLPAGSDDRCAVQGTNGLCDSVICPSCLESREV